ncbi:hypothetical protein ACXWTF_05890 [Thiomicrolovo sp. ZZH C-3]
MNAELRIEYLDNLKKTAKPVSQKTIVYQNETQTLPVYKIDLDYLIYNKYNGRISSYVKSHERQYGSIHPETEEGKVKLEGFLWESQIHRNKVTLKDLDDHGQLEAGIVTKDGVIIDGNRRASLLNKLLTDKKENPKYFRAIVLDETIAESSKDIMRLETTYQMGVDEKVDYNAIEKYLKCKDLKEIHRFTEDEIATMMSEKPAKVKEWLEIMELMDDYLEGLGYDDIYTRLDKTEGIFVDVHKYLRGYTKGSIVPDWTPEEDDIDDLKQVYFDHIRARFSGDGKAYRDIGKISKSSIFCNQEVWEEYRDDHFKVVNSITDEEPSVDELKESAEGADLGKILESRDNDWTNKVTGLLKGNLNTSIRQVEDIKEKESPVVLLKRAKKTLEAIDTDIDTFHTDDIVKELVHEINNLTYKFKKLLK